MKKILWMDDQFEDLFDYAARLFRTGYLLVPVKSVSEALEKLEEEKYDAYIFDLKVFPGDNLEWQVMEERKLNEDTRFAPFLGLELLRFLHKAKAENTNLWKKFEFDFKKVIIFSVASDKCICEELGTFGIPYYQVLNKSLSDLDTLPELVESATNDYPEEKV